MLVTRDGWSVSFETITLGLGAGLDCTLKIFRRLPDKIERCDLCDGRKFDSMREAEKYALKHEHLKYYSMFGAVTEQEEPEEEPIKEYVEKIPTAVLAPKPAPSAKKMQEYIEKIPTAVTEPAEKVEIALTMPPVAGEPV